MTFVFEEIEISVIANKEDLKGKTDMTLLTNHDYRLEDYAQTNCLNLHLFKNTNEAMGVQVQTVLGSWTSCIFITKLS